MRASRIARTLGRVVAIGAVAAAAGCLSRPLEPIEPSVTTVNTEKLTRSRVDKIDLLLMIDNSLSMADKQQILKGAVPDLVKGLVNPPCVNDDGSVASQPVKATDKCASGTERQFDPVLDIHVGVITSSLGSPGASTCGEAIKNDDGHLISRVSLKKGGVVPTYQGKGFLAWDPNGKDDPPGEKNLGDVGQKGLIGSIADLVSGAGEDGCGLEAQLESWYRFLIDPTPALSYKSAGNWKDLEVSTAVDTDLLAERADFLRDDSLVAIIMLTDENDCSIKESGTSYMAASDKVQMWAPRSECAKDPNDACCFSCKRDPGTCPADPTCFDDKGQVRLLAPEADPVNLRCWDQKRRFGENFLQPTDRYVQGLTSPTVQDVHGQLVPNPLYSPLHPQTPKDKARTPDLVFLAGIVGVPWQDIARRGPDGKPDLQGGLDANKDAIGGYMSAEQLNAQGPDGHTGWDVILGNPDKGVPPLDGLMQESNLPRMGRNPVTKEALAPADSKTAAANSINGHEYTAGANLEYACIFDLPSDQQEDCSTVGNNDNNCDCATLGDNPLCQKSDGTYGTKRLRAKGFPGVRELQVLKGMTGQGIVGSVCPGQLQNADPTRKDYGYRATISAIIERLKVRLENKCLSRRPTLDGNGHASCIVLEASNPPDGTCNCDGAARRIVPDDETAAKNQPLKDGYPCICEVAQLEGDAAKECRRNVPHPAVGGQDVSGWCYVDPEVDLGDMKLVHDCPSTEQREIRFVGEGHITQGAVAYVTCKE